MPCPEPLINDLGYSDNKYIADKEEYLHFPYYMKQIM